MIMINSTDAVNPVRVAAVSAKQFQSVYSISTVGIITVYFTVIFLLLPPISQSHIAKTTNPLRPSQSVPLDIAPGTIITCRSKKNLTAA